MKRKSVQWLVVTLILCAFLGHAAFSVASMLTAEEWAPLVIGTSLLVLIGASLSLVLRAARSNARRRAQQSACEDGRTCPACGYDLTGLDYTLITDSGKAAYGVRCPECGEIDGRMLRRRG